MKNYIKFISCMLIMLLYMYFGISFINATEDNFLILDYKNEDILPENFRKTTDLSKLQENNITTLGLKDLNCSGSSQFTCLSLDKVLQNLDQNNITIVDLRQESHGFINCNAISWTGERDNLNIGDDLERVNSIEDQLLSSIPLDKEITLNKGRYTLIPKEVFDEEKLVSSKSLEYFRIPVTDNERPTDLMVDRFITFVLTHPKDSNWIHFHCEEGWGRTTTFLTMYDMMYNAKQVDFETIIARQAALGGDNLLGGNYEKKRKDFIQNFYNYAKSNNDDYKTSWSTYIKENNIERFTAQNEK